MIRYDLNCDGGHGFDAWFRSSADFDAQETRGLLSCPQCGSAGVAKALMAPALAKRSAARQEASHAPASVEPGGEVALVSDKDMRLREMLGALRKHVTETSEDVGERFPEVARRMHAEEIEHRSIRGRATPEEAKALAEEGVPIQPLPHFPDETN